MKVSGRYGHRGGTSTPQLAEEAGVSVDVLRKLEQGGVATPGFFLVARIASVLGVPLDDLAAEALNETGVPS
ncbi:helix-turn-helix domain-containing protein [Janibacter sp. G368]|uniref:helix-turn-helix domain-containing protein n=1 Tax=Janibacter sp. G368 TaxID=3420441 RepID=UPI003CFC9A46